jgi:DmsE family decaheme c-type cytochrome
MKTMTLGGIRALLGAAALAAGLFGPAGAAAQVPGAEVCKGCHEQYVAAFEATKHGAKGNPRAPANNGECAACHGDPTEHVKAGGGKGVGGLKNPNSKNLSADEKSGICLNCHGGDKHLAFWDSGRHRKNEVSCNNCHTIHNVNPDQKSYAQLRKGDPVPTPLRTTTRQLEFEICTTCHKQVRAQIGKPSHHPIIEGKLNCSDCHNPHCALSHAMVKNESVNDLCYTCHADKRGPWLHEHPPVEENCLTCHNSHGSIHKRLLNQKIPNLCQDCHDWSRHPGTPYGGNQGFPPGLANTRFLARACVNCHQQIHGTNAPAARGQRFLR